METGIPFAATVRRAKTELAGKIGHGLPPVLGIMGDEHEAPVALRGYAEAAYLTRWYAYVEHSARLRGES